MSEQAQRRAWSLMTKTRGGTVSILRDLTLEECRQAWERLDPEYGRIMYLYDRPDGGAAGMSWGSILTDGTIEIREVFGPPDWDRGEMDGWAIWPRRVRIGLDDPRHPRNEREQRKAAGIA